MSLFKRSPRRSVAAVATVGALAAAFVIVPVLAAPAFASDTSTATSLFADLNTQRAAQSPTVAAVAPNGFANTAAAGLAKLYAGSGHPCTQSSKYPAPSTPEAPQFNTVNCVFVSKGSNEASRLLARFDVDPSTAVVLNSGSFYTHAGVGVYTKGSKVYAVIDMLGYNEAPSGKLTFANHVTIFGTAKTGHTLAVHFPSATLDTGSTSPIGYEVSWVSNNTTIGTSDALVVPTGIVGDKIKVIVTASKLGFINVTRTSASTKAVAKGTFTTTGGSKHYLQLFGAITPDIPTATPDVTPTYVWKLDGHVAASAPSLPAFFPIAAGDLGHKISVVVTYATGSYTSKVITYTWTHFAGLSYVNSYAPTITGYSSAPNPGETLTAHVQDWSPSPVAEKFTWKVGGVTKGTGTTIVVKSSWVGKKITVTYRASGGLYATTSLTSGQTPKVAK